jgi:hypothetical protein
MLHPFVEELTLMGPFLIAIIDEPRYNDVLCIKSRREIQSFEDTTTPATMPVYTILVNRPVLSFTA